MCQRTTKDGDRIQNVKAKQDRYPASAPLQESRCHPQTPLQCDLLSGVSSTSQVTCLTVSRDRVAPAFLLSKVHSRLFSSLVTKPALLQSLPLQRYKNFVSSTKLLGLQTSEALIC